MKHEIRGEGGGGGLISTKNKPKLRYLLKERIMCFNRRIDWYIAVDANSGKVFSTAMSNTAIHSSVVL